MEDRSAYCPQQLPPRAGNEGISLEAERTRAGFFLPNFGMRFPKPARKTHDLIELIKQRGLIVSDEQAVTSFLERVSYFRLKGYLLHFERQIPGNTTHAVPEGTTFEAVMELYELDRKLRLLVFEAVERIEIGFRSSISNTYCVGYNDPHWFLQAGHFADDIRHPGGPTFHERLLKRIARDIGLQPHSDREAREKEIFVQHYLDKYGDPDFPPTWMLTECLSLGVWAQIYDKLSSRKAQQQIAQLFSVPNTILASWMHALSVTRNICAHHGRIWNRAFVFKPAVLTGYEKHFYYPAGLYAQAIAATYLLRRLYPATKWHLRMKDALLSCPASESKAMGIIPIWWKDPIWSEAELPQISPKTIPPKK